MTWTPPNKRMHPTADTQVVVNPRRAARRVMRGVGQLQMSERLTPISMKSLKCQKCGAEVPVPDLPAQSREGIATTAHGVGRLQAMLELKDGARIGLADAKAIALHLAGEGGTCHRCGTRLTDGAGEQDCPKCRSLNLMW